MRDENSFDMKESSSQKAVGINESAPVIGTAEIQIASGAKKVWGIMTDFENWPSWNKEIQEMALEGPLAPGSVFRWKAGTRIVSRIRYVEPYNVISWSGRTMGIKALHVYTFEERDGRTIVKTRESYEGLMARLLRGYLQKILDKALMASLVLLKGESEKDTQ